MAITTYSAHVRTSDRVAVRHQVINTGGVVTLLITINADGMDGTTTLNLFLSGEPVSKRPNFAHARLIAEGVQAAVEDYVSRFPGVAGE